MSLRSRMRTLSLIPDDGADAGFTFPYDSATKYDEKQADEFRAAVEAQAAATAMIPADCITEITPDATIDKTGLRLTRAAFSDLCHFSGVPVAFIQKLARVDQTEAVDVMRVMIGAYFKRNQNGADKRLVVDTSRNRIEGIVSGDVYESLPNREALDYTLASADGMKLTNGWLDGPRMRFTAVTDKQIDTHSCVGDVVRMGVSVDNAVNGNGSYKSAAYFEVLRCTNGATNNEKGETITLVHRSGISEEVQQAVIQSAAKSLSDTALITLAAAHQLEPEQIVRVRKFVTNPEHGGAPTLDVPFVRGIQSEAEKDGKPEGVYTLWNAVNAVTELQHRETALDKRRRIEVLGYRVLRTFGKEFCLN
jgi:hypothetical protein